VLVGLYTLASADVDTFADAPDNVFSDSVYAWRPAQCSPESTHHEVSPQHTALLEWLTKHGATFPSLTVASFYNARCVNEGSGEPTALAGAVATSEVTLALSHSTVL